MILPFSTQLNGKPTCFVEKIISCLTLNRIITFDQGNKALEPLQFDKTIIHRKKLHTIHQDKNDRWQPGTKIDFFINNRQKNMFRFAPSVPVVSVQLIEIVYYTDREVLLNDLPPKKRVAIDGNILKEAEILQLAQNDGFDSAEEFFEYFKEDFEGKIIHWTNFSY